MRSLGHLGIPASRARATVTRFAVLPIVFLTALVAACGGGAEGTIDHPTGSSEVVLRMETSGGFVPVEYALTQLPDFTLYGDGTVIVNGPMIEIFPQPAMPNLQQAHIPDETVQTILAAAKKAGLFTNGVDYGLPTVTDVGTTTITVNAGGMSYTSSIYAWGFEEETSGVTTEQKQARLAIRHFSDALRELTTFEPSVPWTDYPFTALVVYSLPYDHTGMYDPGVPPNHLDWPLGDLATTGEAVRMQGYRRVVVEDDELELLGPLLAQATRITLWKSGGAEYYLYFRPLLPDEI